MRALHALEDIDLLFKIFYKFVCENFPGKNCRQLHGKSKASVWRNLSTVTAPKICQ